MRDIKGFCKLYDLNIPEFKEFDYYISLYRRIDRWKEIDNLINLFEDLETKVDNILDYKIKKSNEIIEYIKNTRTYNEMCLDNFISDYSNRLPVYEDGKYYLSIDINSANWYAIKSYEPSFLDELGNTYNDLLDKFNVHESLRNSKQFRQYIFGNLNPRKQAKIQRSIIEKEIINKFNYLDLEIAGIKQDEVIYIFNDINDIIPIIDSIDSNIFKYKIFKINKKEDFRINHCLDINLNIINSEIVGCNGNKYFIYLKKYLFEESLDVRDLYFRMDKDLAIWNIDNLKKSLV